MFEILLLIILVIVLSYIFFHYAQVSLSPATPQNSNNSVCVAEKCFFVEVAKTTAEREKGLMNRSHLDENKGMLFIFENEGLYSFWMKDTLIPLDMIWINSANQVVFIAKNVQPCKSLICPSINSSARAGYVLEINGGLSDSLGIKVGDTAKVTVQ